MNFISSYYFCFFYIDRNINQILANNMQYNNDIKPNDPS